MSLAEWAKAQHIHPQTACRWFRAGKLPVPAERVGGLIMVGSLSGDDAHPIGKAVNYARVSSADQKADLDRRWREPPPGPRPTDAPSTRW